MTTVDLDKARAAADAAGADPEHADWAWAAALALIGETSPQTPPARTSAVPDGTTVRKLERALATLTKLRANLGRKLLAISDLAYDEAVARAGVKVTTRSRSRGTGKAVQAQVAAAVAAGAPFQPLLAALGLKEGELLAGGFTVYEAQARAAIADFRRRQAKALEQAGLDPADFGLDLDAEDEDRRTAAAAGFLVGGLLALARGRIMGGIDHARVGRDGTSVLPGEVTGNVPFSVIRDSIGVAEGRGTARMPRTPDDMPELVAERDFTALEEGLAGFLSETDTATWTWVHAFYGDPLTPFAPHEDLGISEFTTADPTGDPDLANSDSFPEGDYYQPGDHDGCTCEWVPTAG